MNIKFGYRMLYEHQGVTLNEHVEVNLFEFIIWVNTQIFCMFQVTVNHPPFKNKSFLF